MRRYELWEEKKMEGLTVGKPHWATAVKDQSFPLQGSHDVDSCKTPLNGNQKMRKRCPFKKENQS